ncbi:hypothetical protein JL720_713 [Aureococcus anophagefferens]|nr:hypothetical protein JL720_713 [Aureococcus anophagefferens]
MAEIIVHGQVVGRAADASQFEYKPTVQVEWGHLQPGVFRYLFIPRNQLKDGDDDDSSVSSFSDSDDSEHRAEKEMKEKLKKDQEDRENADSGTRSRPEPHEPLRAQGPGARPGDREEGRPIGVPAVTIYAFDNRIDAVLNCGDAVLASGEKVVAAFDVNSGEFLGEAAIRDTTEMPYICTCSDDRTVRVWNPVQHNCDAVIRPFNHHCATMRTLFVSKDHLYVGSSDGVVSCDVPLEVELSNGEEVVSAIKMSKERRDGRLYVASWGGKLRVWTVPRDDLEYELVFTLEHHGQRITEVLVSHRHFITCSDDETIRCYGLCHGDACDTALERKVECGSRVVRLRDAGRPGRHARGPRGRARARLRVR